MRDNAAVIAAMILAFAVLMAAVNFGVSVGEDRVCQRLRDRARAAADTAALAGVCRHEEARR